MAAIAAVLDQLDHPVFAAVGAVVVCWYSLQLVLSVLRGVKTYVLTGTLGLSTDLRGLGNWAVVTGATDGIGKAYAEQLAEKGLNIVLLSRTLAKLENVAQEIESRYNVTTKVLQVDFTGGPEIYKHIAELLNNLDIGVLVNNVGTNHSNPEYFTNSPNNFIPDILNVNILACTMMTKIVLPQMVKRRKGVIINISSAAGLNPLPLLLIYSSTKAFMDFLSLGLHKEYASTGIIVQSVMPFFVTTKLSGISNANLMIPTPTDYTKSALQTVGLEHRTNGYLAHSIQGWLFERIPEWVKYKLVMATGERFHSYFKEAELKQKNKN